MVFAWFSPPQPVEPSLREHVLRRFKFYSEVTRDSNRPDTLVEECIKSIINSLRDNSIRHDVTIAQEACKTLSNMAMDAHCCEVISRHRGVRYIMKLMEAHNDMKVQWLACSALWNLARPEHSRTQIGKKGVRLVKKAFLAFPEDERVQETAMGALANLSISDDLKVLIGNMDFLQFFSSMDRHAHSARVQTAACSLITNLAFRDLLSVKLAGEGAAPCIVNAMYNHPDNAQLQRNACAALSNLSTMEVNHVLLLQGGAVEMLQKAFPREEFRQMRVSQLVASAMQNLGLEAHHTTSGLHALVEQCEPLPVSVVCSFLSLPFVSMDSPDHTGHSALHQAVLSKREEAVQMLVTLGADPTLETTEGKTAFDLAHDQEHTTLEAALRGGQRTRVRSRESVVQAVDSGNGLIPELASLVASFISPVDLYDMLPHSTSSTPTASTSTSSTSSSGGAQEQCNPHVFQALLAYLRRVVHRRPSQSPSPASTPRA